MAPTKKSKSQGSNFEQEDVLQAVIVADRFDERFAPLTDDIPLALFPVANKPLIAYTLDFLVSSGVQQIYVYCCSHSGLIKEYLAQSRWSVKSSQCQVTVITSSDFTSLGDVLRDIDQKALFETDFILVNGDLIANISLEKALAEHKERRQKDKTKPLMTLLLRNCAPNHVTRTAEDDVVVALDSTTQQVLHYQKLIVTEPSRLHFPLKNFLQSSKFDLHYNLADAGIALCSPQVPQLFTDNFDYQTKEDFIKGILINEEFLGNQIHVHTIHTGHATRISTIHMYDIVTKAIISRWVYPYVPDHDFERFVKSWSNKERSDGPMSVKIYKHLRRNVYMGEIKSIGRNTSIDDNSVVGHGTTIGSGCKISNSVIGCNCVIGNEVTIQDSHVWSSVTIQDNCVLKKSILSDEVIIHENTNLRPGCVLAKGVEIGPNTTLNDDTVIHIEAKDDEETFAEGDELPRKESDPTVVGTKGRGVLWSSADADESDEEVDAIVDGIWGMSLMESDMKNPEFSDEESSEEDEVSSEGSDYRSDEEDNSVKLFFKEVKDSLARGVEENVKCDNLILEINSSKYAYNVTIQDVVRNVTKAVFEIAFTKSNGSSFFPILKKILLYLTPVFVNYNKTSQSQIDCLQEIELYCLHNCHAFDCLMKILMVLYEKEVLAEEVIVHWHKKPSNVGKVADAEHTPEKLRLSVTKFIDWLQEAEEETSEEDSS